MSAVEEANRGVNDNVTALQPKTEPEVTETSSFIPSSSSPTEDDDDIIIVWDRPVPAAAIKLQCKSDSFQNDPTNSFQALRAKEDLNKAITEKETKFETQNEELSETASCTEANIQSTSHESAESLSTASSSKSRKRYHEEDYPQNSIGYYAKRLQEFDLRGVSDMYAASLQKVVVCLEVLDQTKAALTELSEEMTSQKELVDKAAVCTSFKEIVSVIDRNDDFDIESMFGENSVGDFRKTWDMFAHLRSLLQGVSEQSFNRAAQELTEGKLSPRNPSKQCKVYFYPTKINRSIPNGNWKSDDYTMGNFIFKAGMYFKTRVAMIVIDIKPNPEERPPNKWKLKCKLTLLIRNKIESENGQYYYTEKSIKRKYVANFCNAYKSLSSKSKKAYTNKFCTYNTGLTLDEIVKLENGWIDLHTKTMDIEVDIKAIDFQEIRHPTMRKG